MKRLTGRVALSVVLLGSAVSVMSTRASATCNNQGCGLQSGGLWQTCDLTGGGYSTVQCVGSTCTGLNRTCGKCEQLNGTTVVGCGCVCVDCTNCFGDPE
ncbi:MAG: hypothetical protein AB7G17_06925 [Phycisphaerales bacterium]